MGNTKRQMRDTVGMIGSQNYRFPNKYWLTRYAAMLDVKLSQTLYKDPLERPDVPIPAAVAAIVDHQFDELKKQYCKEIELEECKKTSTLERDMLLKDVLVFSMDADRLRR